MRIGEGPSVLSAKEIEDSWGRGVLEEMTFELGLCFGSLDWLAG